MRTRILHVITSLEAGGAQAMLFKLLGGIDPGSFEQSVAVLMNDGVYGTRIKEKNIQVHSLNMLKGRPAFGSIPRLQKVIADFRPNLIQGWMYHGNIAAEIGNAFTRRSATTLWNIRHSINSMQDEAISSRISIRLGSYLSSLPKKIIYNSNVAAVQHEKLGYPDAKRVLIANGFDTDAFRYSNKARARVRAKLSIKDEEFLVGMIARYHPMKDHGNLIECAQQLEKICPNLRYVIAGTGTCPSNTDLRNLIGQAGLLSKFRMLGEQTELSDLMSAIDVTVLPSAFGEGFPNVLGEAMACERPCIATDVGDSAFVIDDTGIVVPPRDAHALANAIRKVYSMSESERLAIGRKARIRVINYYGLPKIVNDYEALYNSIIEPPALTNSVPPTNS